MLHGIALFSTLFSRQDLLEHPVQGDVRVGLDVTHEADRVLKLDVLLETVVYIKLAMRTAEARRGHAESM